jgi:DNA-binding HxlR family transcriptional regulator
VIDGLADGTRRFSELRRQVDGISQRMLTVTQQIRHARQPCAIEMDMARM